MKGSNAMKKRMTKILATVFVFAVITAGMIINTNAASASLYFSDPTVTVGNNVSIVVTVKGSDISAYEMNISYDTSYLQFVSATGKTGNFAPTHSAGVLRVVDYLGSGSASQMSFTMTFKTLKIGTTKLNPSNYSFSSGSADNITPSAIGNSTVTIKPVPEASSDCNLKALAIEGALIAPEFNVNTTNYTASVDFSVTSLAVTALKNHVGASVYVSGNETLAEGENTVTVTVTAENGATKTYTIKVTRGKNPLASGIVVNVTPEIKAEISNTIAPENVPAGFEIKKLPLGELEVDAIYYDETSLPAVLLLSNESFAQSFYFINAADMTVVPFSYFGSAASNLLMLDVALAQIPEGYEVGKFVIGEVERDVLIPSNVETPNHCLVYALNAAGNKTLYLYDPVENTYQRYAFAELGEPETTVPEETGNPETEEKKPVETEKKEDKKEDKGLFANPIFKWSFIAIAVLIVALGAVGIVLAIKSRY